MVNLLHLTKEQKDFYWAEYERAEQEFEEIMEETVKIWEEDFLLNLFENEEI